MKTNYGEMKNVVLDPKTGRAKLVAGSGVAGNTPRIAASETAGSSPASPRYRSKLEAAYAQQLEAQQFSKEITAWWYEPLNLRLPGKRNFYKPDFLVLAGDGLTFYEVKGRNKSDDRSLVKAKTAAGIHVWARFVWVTRPAGLWEERCLSS